jgi:hypothetical protein
VLAFRGHRTDLRSQSEGGLQKPWRALPEKWSPTSHTISLRREPAARQGKSVGCPLKAIASATAYTTRHHVTPKTPSDNQRHSEPVWR